MMEKKIKILRNVSSRWTAEIRRKVRISCRDGFCRRFESGERKCQRVYTASISVKYDTRRAPDFCHN